MKEVVKMGTKAGQESQCTEWKWSWQDEYLKWLCGYANVDGGTIYIGVNDDGFVVGLKDSKALLEALPNKIRDRLGILASIRSFSAKIGTNIRYNKIPKSVSDKLINQFATGQLSTKNLSVDDKRYKNIAKIESETPIWFSDDGIGDYIEIEVVSYPFAISFEGKYYKRSGSTLQELNGVELQNFLLKKSGLSWDSVSIPNVSVNDLSKTALNSFRNKAIEKGRMMREQVNVDDELLLKRLNLIDDNGNLSRAAIIMFHPDPEQYVTGAYTKIAYFAPEGAYGQNKVDDIIFSDDVHGPLIEQIDEVMDLLYTKYLKALISYKGIQQIQNFMWPREGFREVLLNAMNHKAYETGIPIQIRVYEDKIVIWNAGTWPDIIDVDKIYELHPSVPHNPKMSDVFYRSGEIESWGSGFNKIMIECDKAKAPYPVIEANPKGGVALECKGAEVYMNLLKHGRYYDTYPKKDGVVDGNLGTANPDNSIINDSTNEDQQKSINRMMTLFSEKLSKSEKEKFLPLIEFLKTNDTISGKDAENTLGKSHATASRYLGRLEEIDVIEKIGSFKGAYYKRK